MRSAVPTEYGAAIGASPFVLDMEHAALGINQLLGEITASEFGLIGITIGLIESWTKHKVPRLLSS